MLLIHSLLIVSSLSVETATPTQSLLLIRCCGNSIPEELPEARTDLVHSIWATLENLGATLDISHYNSLLRVYIENEHTFSPHEFLDQLADKKIEPNKVLAHLQLTVDSFTHSILPPVDLPASHCCILLERRLGWCVHHPGNNESKESSHQRKRFQCPANGALSSRVHRILPLP